MPKLKQWKRIRKALTARERLTLTFGILFILTGAGVAAGSWYVSHTAVVPQKGGTVSVGIVGRPLHINPILSASNPADQDLVRLLYAGLFRYNEHGEFTPDLAESYAVGDGGKTIEVTLKDHITWPDGKTLTADDVVFTIQTIQEPEVRSPLFPLWQGIETEALDERTIRFTLPLAFPAFLHQLTVGILPHHIWSEVPTENIVLTELNFKPVGLGPFRPANFERTREGRILSYTLTRNASAPRSPRLDKVLIKFFETNTEAIEALNGREIMMLNRLQPEEMNQIRSGMDTLNPLLPHTFGIFFNQSKSRALTERPVRAAIAHAVNREEFISEIGGELFAASLHRPLPETLMPQALTEAERESLKTYPHLPEQANAQLEASSWTYPEPPAEPQEENSEATAAQDPNIRYKTLQGKQQATKLSLQLTFIDNEAIHAVAGRLKDQLNAVGIELILQPLAPAEYRRALIDREYQIILAGQELPPDPDPYAFWHSSQKFDPGGNLALYDNSNVDAILEQSRQTFDAKERTARYLEFQQILMEEIPAVFLWQSRHVILKDPTLRGVTDTFLPTPSWRFRDVASWYVKTERVFTP